MKKYRENENVFEAPETVIATIEVVENAPEPTVAPEPTLSERLGEARANLALLEAQAAAETAAAAAADRLIEAQNLIEQTGIEEYGDATELVASIVAIIRAEKRKKVAPKQVAPKQTARTLDSATVEFLREKPHTKEQIVGRLLAEFGPVYRGKELDRDTLLKTTKRRLTGHLLKTAGVIIEKNAEGEYFIAS